MSKRLTLIEFIEKATEIHLDKYNYSLVNYIGNKTKVTIVCEKHGIFEQKPNNHLSGQGCKQGSKNTSSEKKTSSTVEFIQKAQEKYFNNYDYSEVEYKTAKTKVKIMKEVKG